MGTGAGRPYRTFLDGLYEAREVIARQTDLTELGHFERPSDFRKGVMTCLVALDKAIKRYEPASGRTEAKS